MSKDDKCVVSTGITSVLFMSKVIQDIAPEHSLKDLMVVKVGDKYQVWTLADFKPKTLFFVPHSTAVKQRFYCSFRSAIAQNSTVGADRRPLVIDGRVRGGVDGKHSFSMYWVVERVKEEEKANLTKTYVKTSFSASIMYHLLSIIY